MSIEVLLTDKDINKLADKFDKVKIKPSQDPTMLWASFVAKAAQLKLLKRLKKPCKNKKHQVGYARDYLGRKVKDCPECMSELEAKIKGER
jgi:hypothetical protein